MNEKKIGWRRLNGENAWIGVRGRVKFFTLRTLDREIVSDEVIEGQQISYLLTYHADNGRPEQLTPMKLSEAQAHAERELENWLAKAGLAEDPQITPAQHAIASALSIVEACWEDGISMLTTDDARVTLATRIALYTALTTLTELAMIKEQIEGDADPVLVVLEKRREVLYEVMTSLKEII